MVNMQSMTQFDFIHAWRVEFGSLHRFREK